MREMDSDHPVERLEEAVQYAEDADETAPEGLRVHHITTVDLREVLRLARIGAIAEGFAPND